MEQANFLNVLGDKTFKWGINFKPLAIGIKPDGIDISPVLEFSPSLDLNPSSGSSVFSLDPIRSLLIWTVMEAALLGFITKALKRHEPPDHFPRHHLENAFYEDFEENVFEKRGRQDEKNYITHENDTMLFEEDNLFLWLSNFILNNMLKPCSTNLNGTESILNGGNEKYTEEKIAAF